MKRMIFELSMPSNNSWNGKWSGSDNKYTVSKRLTEQKAATLQSSYSHAFGDGWVALVSVREAKPREKVTGKFSGYDWMISNIITKGKI